MKYISQFYDINKKTQTEQVLQNMSDIADLKDADDTLQENIDKEVQDRTDADSALAYDIGELQSQIDGLGNVFTLKGSVATYADLPASDNNIGDVWYVEAEAVGYVWIDDNGTERWEQLGLPIDLSDYVTTSDLALALEDYQEKLTAGTNISIIDNVISATSGTMPHLYLHKISNFESQITCIVYNTSSTPFDLTTFKQFLANIGALDFPTAIPTTSKIYNGSIKNGMWINNNKIYCSNTKITATYDSTTGNITVSNIIATSEITVISDTVTQIF